MGRFNQQTTGQEVVETFASEVSGKTFVITGPSTKSIGGATVLALAHAKPQQIFLCGRNKARIDPVIEEFEKINGSTKLHFIQMDLDDLDSVRNAASNINEMTDKIDVLFNNAGIMACPYGKTRQGFESQFGTNHLSHFLFTKLLMPKLLKASHARIVNTSSTGCNIQGVNMKDPNWTEKDTYNPWLAYGASKSANALFAVSLASKGKSHGITAFALQPGMPMTDLYKHLTEEGPSSLKGAMKLFQEKTGDSNPPDMSGDVKTLESASSTLLYAALDPDAMKHSGSYLRNCEIFEVEEHASDPEQAEKLWMLSEQLVGEQFLL